MENSYNEFWHKNTSKVFSVTILLGGLLMFPAILTLSAYNEGVIAATNTLVLSPLGAVFPSLGLEPLPGVINLGVDIAEWFGLGDNWSYRINILFFQLGIAGSALWWLPAALRAAALKVANAFTVGALSLYLLVFLGLQLGLLYWYHLRIAGAASNDRPVAEAIIITAVILIAAVLYIDRKIRESDDQAGA